MSEHAAEVAGSEVVAKPAAKSSRWTTASRAVVGTKVSRGFRTLRDMSADIVFDGDELQFESVLGEGGFGVVEKRSKKVPGASDVFLAIKRLHDQGKAGSSTQDKEKISLTTFLKWYPKDHSQLRSFVKNTSGKGALKGASSSSRASIEHLTYHMASTLTNSMPRTVASLSCDSNDLAVLDETASTAVDDNMQDGVAARTGSNALSHASGELGFSELLGLLSEEDRSFLTEISIMRRLSHPYIIRYLGCGVMSERNAEGEMHEYLCVAQEICEGGSLLRLVMRSSLATGKRLYSYKDALRWCTQIAKALQYLHDSNPMVLHRDLKLENVLLNKVGRAGDVRVMDFGLTKLRRIAKNNADHLHKDTYVMTGCTGSYVYMAPEVVRCEPYNEKVDIFSFATIVYELFSMTLVSAMLDCSCAEDFETYGKRVANGYRQPLKDRWPKELKDLIQDCWAQEATARPTARDVVQRLMAMQDVVDVMEAACPRGVVLAAGKKPSDASEGGCCAVM